MMIYERLDNSNYLLAGVVVTGYVVTAGVVVAWGASSEINFFTVTCR